LHFGYHGNVHHFEFYQHAKSFHTLQWIFLRCFMKFDERNNKKKIPPFLFPWQLRQSLSYRFQFFFGLSRSTRCGCDRKHYCKNLLSLEWIWHFLHLGYHGNGRHFDFFRPSESCHTLRWIFLQSFMKFDERNQKKI
jgi:hypothetical protein